MSGELNPEGIDDDMKRHQWLCWGHDGKAPTDPTTGSYGKHNDPATWGSWDEALALADRKGYGVGFPFQQDAPFVGLDVDVPDSDGWVPDFGRISGAVVERSPSGNWHLFLGEMDIPEWWTDLSGDVAETDEIGVYVDSKYTTVTGDVLEGHGPPIEEVSQGAFEDWLKDAWVGWHEVHLEHDDYPDEVPTPPWESPDSTLEGDFGEAGSSQGSGETDVDIGIYDVISPMEHSEDERGSHPYHGSKSGTNFMVDEDGESFRCWRHEVTGHAGHLLGMDVGILDCGEWVQREIATETWREIYDAAREAGYDIPAKDHTKGTNTDNQATDQATADGGTATASAETDIEPEPSSLDPEGDDGTENDPWTQVRALYADDESENDKLAMNRAVRRLREEIDVATHDEAEALYYYDPGDGTYHRNGEHRVQEHLYGEDKLGGVFYPARARNIIETLKYTTYTPEDEFGSPDDRICLANGVLNTDDPADPVLEPHSPEHLFTSGHPVAYDSDASAPEFETFIEDAVRDEDRAKLQEYAGYCLHSWDQPYKKALMLVGPTNSGKGTFLRILEAVLGAESVSHETLEDLTDSRWSKAQLYDGVANIRNEMSTSRLKHVERFKEMTGRGDTMSAERKNEQKFDFTVTQKFLFATNQVPEVEADDAFNNRWLFASFPHTVPEHEIDADLADRIVENELSGVLNWALEGYARLREQGQFSDERDLDAKDEMWERYGSTVDRFKHACLMVTGDSDDLLAKETVRELYKAFCARVGRESEAAQTVTKDLAADADISHGDRTLPGDRSQTDCYIGVQFNDAALDDLDYEPFDGGGGSGTDGNAHPGSQRTIDDHPRGTDTDPETDTGTSTEDDANTDGRGQDQDRDRSRDHLDGAPDSEVGAIIAQSGSKKTGVGLGGIENRVDADDETVAEELQRLKDKGLIAEPYDERYRPTD